jgi:hypothetical protein
MGTNNDASTREPIVEQDDRMTEEDQWMENTPSIHDEVYQEDGLI